jgi:D-alanyl-D-alanine dipeptidase
MGSPWDFFDPISWVENNQITDHQRANRKLLASVMMIHGFKPLKEEWWHFSFTEEPFPETYFDFPID